jgi:hypothetical protein
MTEPHKRSYRHPKYKTAYRVKNWREYEQSLRDRGDITLWISPEAIAAWRVPMTGIGVDDHGQIIASTVTDGHAQDPSQVPALLSQIDGEIDRCVGDGIYDQDPVYTALANHSPGARVIIPPRKDAVLSNQAAPVPT